MNTYAQKTESTDSVYPTLNEVFDTPIYPWSAYDEGYTDGLNAQEPSAEQTGSEYATGYVKGRLARLRHAVASGNTEESTDPTPTDPTPYDSGYSDGLAGIPVDDLDPTVFYPVAYWHGYNAGSDARNRHIL